MKKSGQVTIFVIVGIVIILAILLFFFVTYNEPDDTTPPSKIPRNFLEKCVEDSVLPSVNKVLDYGGLVQPTNYILKNDHEYNYLCFTDIYYEKCINNYPMLNKIAEEQIRKDSFDQVNECFNLLVDDYESRGYTVKHEPLDYKIEIVPGNVRIRIKKPIAVSLDTEVQNFNDFDQNIPSDLYDLIGISREIVNQEAQNCYFENNGFMILYPEYNLSRVDFVESKIYELQNRKTKETFKFAIRSCPFAPGFINAPR